MRSIRESALALFKRWLLLLGLAVVALTVTLALLRACRRHTRLAPHHHA